jgi:hypothetical protein
MDLQHFIENKLNYYADAVIKGNEKIDEHALGELQFYMALRRVIDERATPEDYGMMDAINDTLQELKIVPRHKTFLKY